MTAKDLSLRAIAGCFLCGLAAAWIALSPVNAQVVEIPYLTGRITDNAGIVSTQARERLAALLKTHERATGNEIAVLTMPSLENGSIEEFAAEVFKSWKLGVKGKDNGVLLIVSPGDRRARIQVGAGLADRLSDAAAGRIVRDLMAPRFQDGDFDRGIEDGIGAIIGSLEEAGAEQGTEQKQTAAKPFFDGPDMSISERILFGAFIFGIIGLFTIIGVVTPGAGWFLYLFLIPFWAMFPIVIVGTRGALILLITYLICFPAAKLTLAHLDWYRRAKSQLSGKGVAQIGGFTVKSGGGMSSWSSGGESRP